MSEGSFWPKTWREAIPLLVWGVLIFASGFEGIATLVHGDWIPSIISFALMVGLTAMLIHWERLQLWITKLSPNWLVGGVVLILFAIIMMPIWRPDSPRQITAPHLLASSPRIKVGPEYLKGIQLGGEASHPLVLEATSAVTVDRLRVFVDYSLLLGVNWQQRVRATIGEIREPVKNNYATIQLVSFFKPEAEENELWFGDPKLRFAIPAPSQITPSNQFVTSVRARVVIIGNGSEEQHHYFNLLRIKPSSQGQVLFVVPEPATDWVSDWEAEK